MKKTSKYTDETLSFEFDTLLNPYKNEPNLRQCLFIETDIPQDILKDIFDIIETNI
jgi:hypothetical protein